MRCCKNAATKSSSFSSANITWVAHASRDRELSSDFHFHLPEKVKSKGRFGATPKPARETRALPNFSVFAAGGGSTELRLQGLIRIK
ncbi:MAG: hypothetical protein DME74_09610 [Verrucomicrobia bacterium]|nr:MAG: hypothetical protein DME74_09610 [Verrucomicrobiota bacterium]